MKFSTLLLAICIGGAALSPAAADVPASMTPAATARLLNNLNKALNSYVDPKLGAVVQARLKARRGDYQKITDTKALMEAITADMVKASEDGHLTLRNYDAPTATGPRTDDAAARAAQNAARAQGLVSLRRLPGNIGYLKINGFFHGEPAEQMIDGALTLLKDTDALIIDLRENGGGGGNDARLVGNLSREPIPMMVVEWRQADGSFETMKREVSVGPDGPIYPDKPVYVLTAKRTYSAAEGVSLVLQTAKRAVLVGETTGGGGNPSNRPVLDLGDGFGVFVPNGRNYHPVTKANWEDIGVRPDIETPPAEALTKAYVLALAAARPSVSSPRLEKERNDALADPAKALAEN